jgi:hypothetical protein
MSRYLRTGRASKPNRTESIAAWKVQVNRAWNMGQGSRVPTRPLTAFSANEIVNMTWTLARTLDKIEAAARQISK